MSLSHIEAIVEQAFTPLDCSCQPQGHQYLIRICDPQRQDATPVYQTAVPRERLLNIRSASQLILEIRQHMATEHIQIPRGQSTGL